MTTKAIVRPSARRPGPPRPRRRRGRRRARAASRALPTRTSRGPSSLTTVAPTPPPTAVANPSIGRNPSSSTPGSGDDGGRRAGARCPSRRTRRGRGPREPRNRRRATTSSTTGRPRVSVPGLVEHDGVDLVGGLERLAAADEDAGLRAAPGPDHDRGRRGEAHRARAGDDEDRDERDQGVGQPRLGTERHPDEERRGRDDEDESGRRPRRSGRPGARSAPSSPGPARRARRCGRARCRARRAWHA